MLVAYWEWYWDCTKLGPISNRRCGNIKRLSNLSDRNIRDAISFRYFGYRCQPYIFVQCFSVVNIVNVDEDSATGVSISALLEFFSEIS